MLQKKNIAAFVVGAALAAAPAFAQEGYRSEAAVQAFGSFVKDTVSNGVQQSATDSGGVLATYRFFLTDHQGVEVNYGYSRNTQNYLPFSGSQSINANQHEVTAAYVFRFPMAHFTPFVESGVGGIVFDPRDYTGASTQARAAFVYGGGVDLNFTKRVFMRAEYRGLVYNSPTFDSAAISGYDRVTHRAEPSIGFGYRF